MDFVSNVSHEFKTPINAIEGYTMLLQGEELSQEQEEYVEKILFNTQRLSGLVGNILLLSKLENQNLSLIHISITVDILHADNEIHSLPDQVCKGIKTFVTTVCHKYGIITILMKTIRSVQ